MQGIHKQLLNANSVFFFNINDNFETHFSIEKRFFYFTNNNFDKHFSIDAQVNETTG